MSGSDIAAALFTQGAKLAKGLSEDECKQLLSGEAKIGFVPRGHRVLEYTSVLDKALRALQKLSPDELQQIEDGHAKLAVLRPGEKITKPFDPAATAEAVSRLATEGEIVRFLNADSSLGPPNLKKLATALTLPLPPTVKTKQAIQSYIAQNLVQDRNRWSLR
jgi:hypothetical protein